MKELITLAAGIAVIAAMFYGMMSLMSARCEARWPNNHTEWSVIAKCMVQQEDGKMIPEDRIWFDR